MMSTSGAGVRLEDWRRGGRASAWAAVRSGPARRGRMVVR